MYIKRYFDKVKEILDKIIGSQLEYMEEAAKKIVDTTLAGKMIYVFGATHASILAQESFYRTGGLVNMNPILPEKLNPIYRPITMTSMHERIDGYGAEIADSYGVGEGDLIFIHSVSGRNSVAVDMAIRAREKGAYVIAITSLEYSRNSKSRAGCGLRLFECADLVIDNCGVFGDAVIEIEGFAGLVSPTSTVSGAAIINGIVAEACSLFVQRGITPPIFMSANINGGDEHNRVLLEEYKSRIIYM